MPRRGRRDTTHARVRDELRALGYSVADLGDAGGGFPDLVVGMGGQGLPDLAPAGARGLVCRGRVYLVEVKSPGGKLSKGQREFARDWRGCYIVAEDTEGVLDAIAESEGMDGPV